MFEFMKQQKSIDRPNCVNEIGIVQSKDVTHCIPRLTTVSSLISEFQISRRTSENLNQEFKLSAKDLDIQLRVRAWI